MPQQVFSPLNTKSSYFPFFRVRWGLVQALVGDKMFECFNILLCVDWFKMS